MLETFHHWCSLPAGNTSGKADSAARSLTCIKWDEALDAEVDLPDGGIGLALEVHGIGGSKLVNLQFGTTD